MFNKALSVAALALAASQLASAQTFTDCNPLKKSCPADKAFSGETVCDFTQGACDAFSLADGTTLKYDGKGATFAIQKESNAPTIHTGKYIFFGRIDVVVQAADGQGIVTSAVLQSDDLDEIDWEWVGGDDAQVQTNYFSKGDTTTYDRGAYHPVSDPLGSFHKYSVEWTSAAVNWLIDDKVVRTLSAASATEGFPQTPMQVKLGTWVAGGKDSAKGTVEWAGGYTDFTKAPFNAYYKSITIVDYAGGDAPCKEGSVEEYVYGDHSGNWDSIIVKKSDGSSDETTTKSASKTASSTKTAEETSTSATKSESASATETESETETKTTESAKETKTQAHTTFTTAAATTGSDSSPSKTTGGDAPAATTAATVSGTAEPTVSTVPASGASRMAGSILAVAGLFLAQLL